MVNGFDFASIEANKRQIRGELTRKTIHGKQQKVFAQLLDGSTQDIDLSKVSKFDSAGLAWLLALFEFANEQQIVITYSQPPQEFRLTSNTRF